ncbi:MAG: hypothetical protein WDO73_03325 [Ignavibacteriota bacterium]
MRRIDDAAIHKPTRSQKHCRLPQRTALRLNGEGNSADRDCGHKGWERRARPQLYEFESIVVRSGSPRSAKANSPGGAIAAARIDDAQPWEPRRRPRNQRGLRQIPLRRGVWLSPAGIPQAYAFTESIVTRSAPPRSTAETLPGDVVAVAKNRRPGNPRIYTFAESIVA